MADPPRLRFDEQGVAVPESPRHPTATARLDDVPEAPTAPISPPEEDSPATSAAGPSGGRGLQQAALILLGALGVLAVITAAIYLLDLGGAPASGGDAPPADGGQTAAPQPPACWVIQAASSQPGSPFTQHGLAVLDRAGLPAHAVPTERLEGWRPGHEVLLVPFPTPQAASACLGRVQRLGFPDAFVRTVPLDCPSLP